jgi:hypothetical protein
VNIMGYNMLSPITTWGVNVHMTGSTASAEIAQACAAFAIARADFTWASIENTKAGTYDFSGYDTLYEKLLANKCSPYFILDYGNERVYPGCGAGPNTPRCVSAFVNFSVAAFTHFATRSHPPVWELWNEPNTQHFWGGQSPTGNATEYAQLALAIYDARLAYGLLSSTTLVGPAVAGFGGDDTWAYLQVRCMPLGRPSPCLALSRLLPPSRSRPHSRLAAGVR